MIKCSSDVLTNHQVVIVSPLSGSRPAPCCSPPWWRCWSWACWCYLLQHRLCCPGHSFQRGRWCPPSVGPFHPRSFPCHPCWESSLPRFLRRCRDACWHGNACPCTCRRAGGGQRSRPRWHKQGRTARSPGPPTPGRNPSGLEDHEWATLVSWNPAKESFKGSRIRICLTSTTPGVMTDRMR